MPFLGRLRISPLVVLVVAAIGGSAPRIAAAGAILVTNNVNGTVGEWSTTGSLVNGSLITGLNSPNGVVAGGGYIYVANNGNNTVGKYDSAGQVVDASFITGLNGPTNLLFAGDALYVMNQGNAKIGTYSVTTGSAVNPSFVTLTNSTPVAMAISGTSLFVLAQSTGGHLNNFVVKYSSSDGSFIGDIIPTLNANAWGLAASGTSLYVSYYLGNGGYISQYTTAGTMVSEKLIDNLDAPRNLAISGSSLYVYVVASHVIGEYDLSGSAINASLVTGLSGTADNFTVVPVPEPASTITLSLGAAGLLFLARRQGLRFRVAV